MSMAAEKHIHRKSGKERHLAASSQLWAKPRLTAQESSIPNRIGMYLSVYIHRLRYISDINIVYTWYTLCAIKYISNILIPSMVTKQKKTIRRASKMLITSRLSWLEPWHLRCRSCRRCCVVVVEVGSLGSLGSCSGSPGNLKGTCNEREANI